MACCLALAPDLHPRPSPKLVNMQKGKTVQDSLRLNAGIWDVLEGCSQARTMTMQNKVVFLFFKKMSVTTKRNAPPSQALPTLEPKDGPRNPHRPLTTLGLARASSAATAKLVTELIRARSWAPEPTPSLGVAGWVFEKNGRLEPSSAGPYRLERPRDSLFKPAWPSGTQRVLHKQRACPIGPISSRSFGRHDDPACRASVWEPGLSGGCCWQAVLST